LDFEDLKIDSSLERLDFSRRISGVIKGLDGVDGMEEVFVGACLSSRVERVSENCCTQASRVVAGEEYSTEAKTSLENCLVSILLIGRVVLVVRVGRDLTGIEKLERTRR